MSAPTPPAQCIVIATPHDRYDSMVKDVGTRLPEVRVERIRQADELSAQRLQSFAPRYVFLPHWSWRVPEEVHRGFDCVVFHMTDLPFGRGGSPLQNLIVRGIRETRLSALQCAQELDAGAVYMKRPLSLAGSAEEIYRRAGDLMADMIVEIVRRQPLPEPQVGEPTYFARRRPEEGNLGTLSDLDRVYDFIRMLDAEGYPHAFLETEHLRLEFTQAERRSDEVRAQVRVLRKISQRGKQ